ncbi:MAG: phosphoglycerate dehydrogenase [Candidatus Abyssobacteria bacterium SURF_17]|jgi:D-3-phosphoglycerate dehydrogenase|uniref:D-3-phosphoglycerate dehydrogenase n=1 Tax=Candidatus Abyssobacteria bacterium SURF_17 TaxID=2093361 RepID=A0A419EW25_9BACT|nr:MAG: phosphoglycerate dehydrogenase [Candidatus Abyssubacteria bacterium SURF_17]
MPKILVADRLSKAGLEVFSRHKEFEVTVEKEISPQELKAAIPEFDALVVRSSTKVTSDVLAVADNLKVIGRAGIGVDNIDVAAATLRGVVVMNTPQENAIAAAEHTISLMMALARRVPQADASLRAGRWEKSRFVGTQLLGKTLGVIGIGNIGGLVAERAEGLKMRVIAYDPYIPPQTASRKGIPLVSLDELLARSDFVTIHIPLTEETRGLINAAALKKMSSGSMLINCARGGIVNEHDLHEALATGHLAGAALDVFEVEPPVGNPLCRLDNVICTPHLGASTYEAQEGVAVAIAEQIADYLLHGTLRNAVNVPSVSPELLSYISPFMTLGEKLGKFLAQISDFAIEEIVIEYQGEVVERGVSPITSAVLKGVFASILGNRINIVNAPAIARDRGVSVREVTSRTAEDFVSLMSITVRSGDKQNYVAGTIFGKKEIRIVRVNNFEIEAIPSGHFLFIFNYDRPGVIGNVGTTLAKHRVNIATMYLGRDMAGGRAVSLWHIDSPISKEIVDELAGLPNIISIRQMEL